MKKYLFSIITCSFFIISNAQTEGMKFVGIPMDQAQSVFIDALKQKGFTDEVTQKNWNLEGFECKTLSGSFWKFDDCDIRVKYSITTDSVASVLVRRKYYSIWHSKVSELMNNLDIKYGEKISIRRNTDHSTYRWFSKEPYGMVEINCVLMEDVGLDFFGVEYFTSEETKRILGQEAKEKQKELEDL